MMEGPMEILLVEDDPRDVRMTVRELKHDGIEVEHTIEVARDGEEALDFLFCRGAHRNRSITHPPALVLLDLKLPKVSGLEVLREVKAKRETQAIPVVVLTSSREDKDMIESYKLGVNSYVQKPVDFDQFRQTIKTLGLYWLAINQAPPAKTFAASQP